MRSRRRPDDLATLIYTSGTTGEMKGVMLTHGNITSNVTTCCRLFTFSEDDECLSFLPLSHIFERMFGHYSHVPLRGADQLRRERRTRWRADMERSGPRLMASVPRLYEKIYGRVLERVRSGSALKRRLFFWAKGVGESWVEQRLAGTADPAGAVAAILAGRPAGLCQAAGPHRRPAPLLHLGRRAAVGRHRPVLPCGRHADPRGLWTHRDLPGHRGQHLRAPPARHRGPADSGRGGEDRGGWRDPDPGPQRHDGLLPEARRPPPRRSTATAGSTPATSACSTRTGSSRSPTARRT